MARKRWSPRWLRIQCLIWWVFFAFETTLAQDESEMGLPTVTVRGFLNFKTTVDGTVIVFTPAATEGTPSSTRPRASAVPHNAFLEKEVLNSREGMHGGVSDKSDPPRDSLHTSKSSIPDLNIFDNNQIKDPFLQHISDNAVLPSAGQVNNDLDKIRKLQSSQNHYPTGLVTVLGGTFVDGLSTTVYETKVIGTYIDGKYAQILQSTSHIVMPPSSVTTPALSVLTVERTQNKDSSEFSNGILKGPFSSIDKFFTTSQPTKSKYSPISSKVEASSPSLKQIESVSLEVISATTINPISEKDSSRGNNGISSQSNNIGENGTPRLFVKQGETKSSPAALESSFAIPQVSKNEDADLPTETLESAFRSSSIRKMSTLVPVSSTLVRLPDDDNTVLLTKTHRNSTSRTRFLSPRRPSQTVRLNRFKVKLTLRQDSPDGYNVTLPADDEDLEEDLTPKEEEDLEDVTESIGTLVEPASVVFQETTITSEVTLHVGRRKSVRTLTITTSIPLTVNPADIQDILSSQSTAMDRSDNDHHIVTRTFTTTERALKTSVVPIFDGKSTMFHTVTESFFIMKIITAYRTLPPGDPSALESYLDEPEIFATDIEANSMPTSLIQSLPGEQIPAEDTIQSSIIVPPAHAKPQITNPLLSFGNALSNNPFAAVYLGLQQFNAQMTLYSTVTDVSTYEVTETIYSTKTIRLYDGRSTRYRIISEPISTKKSTATTTITSVQPFLNTHAIQQQQQLHKLIAATQPQPQFSTATSTYTTVSIATSLSTRIYTLIYNGFSTKFRTVTSSTLYPTTVTVTSTTKLVIAPTPVNLPFAYPYTS